MMGREERREGRNSGREEGKEAATRERGRHKKKIIADAYTQRSPAKSLISSSSHAPPPLSTCWHPYSPRLRSSGTPTLCYSRFSLPSSWAVCQPETHQMNITSQSSVEIIEISTYNWPSSGQK
jgi:hypothetical protein